MVWIKNSLWAIAFCLLLPLAAAAQDSTDYAADEPIVYAIDLPKDSSQINARAFDQQKLEEIRQSENYRYEDTPPELEASLWDRFVRWLSQQLAKVLLDQKSNSWLRITIYVIAGVAILYSILKLLGVDVRAVFYRKSDQHILQAELMEEDLHTRNFDREIADAVAEQRYREAIRLHYLHSLQKLSDAQLIHWKIDKTNREYAFELKSKSLKAPFTKVTSIFENAYYGNFPVTQAVFEKANSDFQTFKSLIPQHAPA